MPGYDRTGPFGEGPLSGGGFGECRNPQRGQPLPADVRRDNVAGRGGRGRGRCGGRRRAGRGAAGQPAAGRRRSGGAPPTRAIERQAP